ncbi:MAG: hypothetical protein M5U22_00715 [Thermoleophilia bacterium]|nr:hypothetical protein [Thermoleophilia bacterium]
MESRFDSYAHPPGPQDLDLPSVWPAIEAEARRQLGAFYPVMDREAEARTVKVIEGGIYTMLKRGAARHYEGRILFWNPVEGLFQEYDEEYNQLMLGFMRDFKSRYQAAMQTKAPLN